MIKIFGDLHLKNNIVTDKPIYDFIKSNVDKDDIIIFAGDIFDNFNVGITNIGFYDLLSELEDVYDSVYLLTGNHDVSQGRISMRIINHFSKKVKVIEQYEHADIKNIRLHFYNYFRYETKQEFLVSDSLTNIMVSHCDMEKESDIPDNMKSMYKIFNGHIHDGSTFGNVINIGSIRMLSTAENNEKSFYTLNEETLQINKIDFEPLLDIIRIPYAELKQYKPVINTILISEVSGLEDKDEKKALYDTFNNTSVIIREENIKNNELIQELVSDINVESGILNIKDMFVKYLDAYDSIFGCDYDRDTIIPVFEGFHFDTSINTNNYSFDIISVQAENFKLYEQVLLNAADYNGITLVKGENYDETKDDEPSSNESGKSIIRELFEYSLLGISSGITHPLRFGEKNGFVEVVLKINDDVIKINRRYTAKTSDLHILINDEEFAVDSTNTDKESMLYEKYKIKDALQFIFLSDTGIAPMFFSSKNSDRFKIFKDLFPIIQNVSDFIGKIKCRNDEVIKKYEDISTKNSYLLDNRRSLAKIYRSRLQEIKAEIKEINIQKDEINKNIESVNILPCKYTEPDILNLQNMKCSKPEEINVVKDISYLIHQKEKLIKYNMSNNIKKEFKDVDIRAIIEKVNLLKSKIDNNNVDVLKQELSIYNKENSSITLNINRLKLEVSDSIAELEKINNSSIIGKCLYCGNDIKDITHIKDHGESIKNKIANINTKIDSENSILLDNTKKIEDIESKILTAVSVLDSIKSEYHTLNSIILDIKSKYDISTVLELLEFNEIPEYMDETLIEEDIKKYQKYMHDKMEYEKYEEFIKKIDYTGEDIASLLEIIENNKIESNRLLEYKIQIGNIENQYRKLLDQKKILFKDVIESNKTRLFDITDIKIEYVNITTLYKILTAKRKLTFEKYFINNFFVKVEDIFNAFLGYLFNRDIVLKVDDMNFIFYQGNDELQFKGFSTGGKTKLSIALVLTINSIFRTIGVNSKFLYVDEFLDGGIDSINIQKIFELLRAFYVDEKVWVVSHKQVDDFVDNKINVKRLNNTSIIN